MKTPQGWTTIGALCVGDTITAWDGTPTQVTGVFPQGPKDIYRITFFDGRTVDCTADHLWRVYYVNTQPHKRWRVVDTLEVLRLISMPDPRVYIQLIEPEQVPDAELPMEPYTLGVILGDGCISGNSVSVSKPDQEIFNEIAAHLPEELRLVRHNELTQGISGRGKKGGNTYLNALRDMGLMGKLSYDKFIPEIYLLKASASQRMALLQGLLDTDGTATKVGSIQYSTSSQQLARDVQYLVRSLGWMATMWTKEPTYTHNGEKKDGRLHYVLQIRSTKPSSCFRLPRKKELVNDDNQYASKLKLAVRKVELVDIDEAVCISIDHPDKLFVTNDFIVTHNTYTAMRIGSILAERICVMLRPKYIDQWLRDFKQNCVIDPKKICVIQGGQSLKDLLVMADNGCIPYDVIIVSADTFRGYIDKYEEHEALLEEEGYCVPPHQFFEHIKAGLRLIDEGHENFHFNFKLDLYTNVHDSVTLSATMFNDNPFVESMMRVAYPKEQRYDTGEFDKYVTAYSLHYSLRVPSEVKVQGSQGYSHHELEKSLMKYPNKVDAYFKMVQDSMKYTYDVDYRPGDKCLVYFASIEMCTQFADYIQEVYPHLRVARFVADDAYEDLMNADISVSTIGSAGTGKDIPGLTTVILTVNVHSSPSNLQGFGRLRDLNVKDPTLNRKMYFVYFVGDDFEKHVEYHEDKVELLRTRALSYEKRFYGTMI